MISILRTDSKHPHFISLVKELDTYLAEIDGNEHSFYSRYNQIDMLNHVIIVYENELPVACGAFKMIDTGIAEVKRMYTLPAQRNDGKASLVLYNLERWASETGFHTLRLETGKRMPDAVAFYQKKDYLIIPNYGQYAGVENSICFEKRLIVHKIIEKL